MTTPTPCNGKNFVKVSSSLRQQGAPWDRGITRIGSGPDFSELSHYAESRGQKVVPIQTPVAPLFDVVEIIATVMFSLPFLFLIAIVLLHLFGGGR